MIKCTLLAALTAATLAIAATPAFAVDPSPTLPHDDQEADNWTMAVAVYLEDSVPRLCPEAGCPFESAGNSVDWEWDWPDVWPAASGSCIGSLEGAIDPYGYVTVAAGTLWSSYPGASGCQAFEVDAPWEGTICTHKPTGEFWLRQEVAFTTDPFYGLGDLTGVTYGRLVGTQIAGTDGVRADTLRFGDTWSSTYLGTDDGSRIYGHAGEFPLDEGDGGTVDLYGIDSEFNPDGPQDLPCFEWPELS
jgi:hypothetical protein